MEGIQLGWRVLWSFKVQTGNCWIRTQLGGRKDVGDDHHRSRERHMRNGEDVRRLRGDHPFAAIVTLHRRIAGHGATALHTLLVLRHSGKTVRELQAHQGEDHNDDD